MREVTIERYLSKRTLELGGRAFKWVSPGAAGVPDRIVLLPGRPAAFLELKRPGEAPTALQRHQIAALRSLGHLADWTDSKAGVDAFLERVAA